MRSLLILTLIAITIFVSVQLTFAQELENNSFQNLYNSNIQQNQYSDQSNPPINNGYANLNQHQENIENDTHLLELTYVDCKYGKGKVLGENIRIDFIIDGYDLNLPINQKLKTGKIWTINQTYDYLDFIILRFWDDNVFQDRLIGEIRLDKGSLNQFNTTILENKDATLEVSYKVIPGPGYRPIIMNLRQLLSSVNKELIILRKENKRLSDEKNRLDREKRTLSDEIYRLRREQK